MLYAGVWKELGEFHLGNAGPKMDLGEPLLPISQRQLGGLPILSPSGRGLAKPDVEVDLGRPSIVSHQGSELDSQDKSELEPRRLEQWCEEDALKSSGHGDNEWSTYPWYAPRVILQYLETQMRNVEPIQWSVDNYDGVPTWVEIQTMPDSRYKGDINPTGIQHRELRAALMQLEMETDTPREIEINQDQRHEQWGCTTGKVRMICIEMYNRIRHINATTDEMAQTNRNTGYNELEEVRNHERGI